MDLGLEGKVAFVTGGGQGVGRRICIDLAREGVAVAVNDLFPERAQRVASEIMALGGKAVSTPADVTDPEAIDAAVAAVDEALGPVGILVNNAGVLPERRERGGATPYFLDTPRADWARIMALNVHGAMNCCAAVLPGMKARGSGKIVSITSEAGRTGEARLAVYSGAKAALLGFSKALALEHGRDCINVNVVALGAVSHEGIKDGPLREGATPDNDEHLGQMLRLYPIGRGLGRLACPDDVSGIVCFLASERAAYITGQSLGVSGGYVRI